MKVFLFASLAHQIYLYGIQTTCPFDLASCISRLNQCHVPLKYSLIKTGVGMNLGFKYTETPEFLRTSFCQLMSIGASSNFHIRSSSALIFQRNIVSSLVVLQSLGSIFTSQRWKERGRKRKDIRSKVRIINYTYFLC